MHEAETYAELARVIRSGFTESKHFGSLLALNADGTVALSLGVPDEEILPRSTYKPLQAVGLLEAGLRLKTEQLAVAIGSHVGASPHQEMVRSILDDFGLNERLLGCPPDYPEDAKTRNLMIRDGVSKKPICMNCSGKHAAMLAACRANSWPTETYLEPTHPLQQIIRDTVEKVSGVSVKSVAVDGCGVPLFGTSVRGVAQAFQQVAQAEADSKLGKVANAMRSHPVLVQGEGQYNTLVMQHFQGSIAKGGAEGVLGMATLNGESVGVKVIDGSLRATTVIALQALEKIGALPMGSLTKYPDLGYAIFGGSHQVGQIEAAPQLK